MQIDDMTRDSIGDCLSLATTPQAGTKRRHEQTCTSGEKRARVTSTPGSLALRGEDQRHLAASQGVQVGLVQLQQCNTPSAPETKATSTTVSSIGVAGRGSQMELTGWKVEALLKERPVATSARMRTLPKCGDGIEPIRSEREKEKSRPFPGQQEHFAQSIETTCEYCEQCCSSDDDHAKRCPWAILKRQRAKRNGFFVDENAPLVGAIVDVTILACALQRWFFPGKFIRVWGVSTFLHLFPHDMFFNLHLLMTYGPAVEALFGSRRTIAVYLAAGIAGDVASARMLAPHSVSIGASAAICGLAGAFAAFSFRHRGVVDSGFPRWRSVLYFLLMILVKTMNLLGAELLRRGEMKTSDMPNWQDQHGNNFILVDNFWANMAGLVVGGAVSCLFTTKIVV
jgi:membrane associated rhomboid family serine protease